MAATAAAFFAALLAFHLPIQDFASSTFSSVVASALASVVTSVVVSVLASVVVSGAAWAPLPPLFCVAPATLHRCVQHACLLLAIVVMSSKKHGAVISCP